MIVISKKKKKKKRNVSPLKLEEYEICKAKK